MTPQPPKLSILLINILLNKKKYKKTLELFVYIKINTYLCIQIK